MRGALTPRGPDAPADQERYDQAFRAIDADPAHLLVVLETTLVGDADPAVVGTMQLTFLPGLARAGATRMQIEAVRVSADLRGQGAGERLGFVASHTGFKLAL